VSRGNASRRFTNVAARNATLAFGSLVSFLGVCGVISGDAIAGAAFFAAGVALGGRGRRSSTVELTSTQVRLIGFAHTRQLPLADLARVEVAIGRTGWNGSGREYLVFELRDGSSTRFTELNAKPSRSAATLVQIAVQAINDAIPDRS
jgi:hypothetical protein